MKKLILIVDDVPENIKILEGFLKNDYDMKAAKSGIAALKIAQKFTPDLILLDIVMPDMDGYETCQKLRVNPVTRDIPVIFVTSNTEANQIAKGFEVGGVDYITKPFNPQELKARVSNHLSMKESREKLAMLASKLGKYLSSDVYESIFTGEKEVALGSAKKRLTVFFSDIVNFSGTVENFSSDKLVEWLNSYLHSMAQITAEFNGTLDKFIGDAVMVFFGDPHSKGEKEDACRCINMAKSMVKVSEERGYQIRIGINTGDCTVGNFGSEERMDYSIIGNEVNVAARLEHNSEPNRILISESTYNLVADEIPCTLRGEITVKNIKKPINVYWVD